MDRKDDKDITLVSGFKVVHCEEHGYRGVAPCPWPNCKKGISGSKFKDNTFPEIKEEIISERVRWTTVDGSERYVWRQIKLPTVFSVGNLCRDELYRKIKKYPKLIYHYTDIKGLKGIVENQELWLTDFAFLNDSKEISHGIECTNEILKKKISDIADPFFSQLLFTVEEKLKIKNSPRICLICYSCDNDSLGQWRGYGHGGKGVAIGMPSDSYYFFGLEEIYLGLVVYDRKVQLNLIENFIHFFHESYRTDKDYCDEKKDELYISLMLSTLFEFFAFFKDSSFTEEREFRLIHIEHPSVYGDGLLKPASRRFRTSSNFLIPYCTTKDIRNGDDKRVQITEVVIGPHPEKDFVRNGIREFLDTNGYHETEIKLSNIPFR